MTPLCAKMIKAMQVRGFSVRTHESYLAAVTDLARYVHRSPDKIGIEDIRGYFEYLATERPCPGQAAGCSRHPLFVSAGARLAGLRRRHPDPEEGPADPGAAHPRRG